LAPPNSLVIIAYSLQLKRLIPHYYTTTGSNCLFSDIADEDLKAEVEQTVEDSLQRAQQVLNLTASSAENIRKFHPRFNPLDPNAVHNLQLYNANQAAQVYGAGAVSFGLVVVLVLVLIAYCFMALKGMRGQLDLDMDTINGAPPRAKLKFTNPFNPERGPSPELPPSHISYGADLTPSSIHGSDLVVSDETLSEGDSVNIYA